MGEPTVDPRRKLAKLPTGSEVEITRPDGRTWHGILVPATEFSAENVVVLKLATGYNVGLAITERDVLTVIERARRPRTSKPSGPVAISPPPPATPWVALLTTGGTIASRVDYQTGGVKPVRDEREILESFPALDAEGPVRVVPVFERFSEDIVPSDWVALAEKIGESFRQGARGVVIAHGTDTMGYTAAALSFMVRDPPGPVVLVGAQRSPDRPSSDGFTNLPAAIHLARTGDLGEVVVVMHDGVSDDRFTIHRGSRVRKMHSSRRDAFESRNAPPLGHIEGKRIQLGSEARRPSGSPIRVDTRLDARAALVTYYPGLSPIRLRRFVRADRGLVLAGTGLGHVSRLHIRALRRLITNGLIVAMTTQCLGGGTDPFVYSTGRELVREGVVYLDDLLPETAYAKMLWALGQADDPARVRALLLEDIAGEFVHRRRLEGGP
ncbi:MAG: Glu-tRNA(Gln) amidotransferase subunit GatD [Thermoplasmata archaeon]|nr:Glu-tRNA(Gln) amidotransferase subunit GatD [Thermoplasmata archaeon]